MAAGVAHEIRNPLGGIGLYSSLLERDLKDRPAQEEIAARISAGVRNMEAIVGEILAFAGDAEPNRRPVRLARVIEEAVEQAMPSAREMGAHIDMQLPPEEVELLCDAGQIERALLNLILNGLDAAGDGGCVLVSAVARVDEEGLFCICVEDTGPGIAPQFLQRVFNPFFTTKDTGTGLGLAIVHRIAEAHGGRVSAGNRREGGAVFSLLLPLPCGESPVGSVGGER
jgi:two-component system sensor histidine kinase HydH